VTLAVDPDDELVDVALDDVLLVWLAELSLLFPDAITAAVAATTSSTTTTSPMIAFVGVCDESNRFS